MHRTHLHALILALAGPGSATAVAAQETPATVRQDQPLRIFLDCQRCDFDHLRREVTFVDYVRDRTDAQVHVLVTSQGTGSGGQAWTLYFIGQGAFENRSDTLGFTTRQAGTEDEEREALTRTFALGLIPFAARTGIAPGLSVDYEAVQMEAAAAPADDPWNLWVFRMGVGASVDGESRQSAASFDGSFSASRTTEQFKTDFDVRGDYESEEFELNDGEIVTSVRRSFNANALVVWSLGAHWSTGVFASATSSTRQNQDLALQIAPALEYNVYRYAESTRRQILFTYTVGPVRYDYDELTLFEQLSETLVRQELDISARFQQPWGEIDASLEGSNYFHDLELHRVELFTGIDIRLFRGLSLDLRGNVARIKDQIYIPLGDLSDDDILLERRELGTDFEYELNVGFSYSFGSPFNNVVNPRLRLGGGGGRGGGGDFRR